MSVMSLPTVARLGSVTNLGPYNVKRKNQVLLSGSELSGQQAAVVNSSDPRPPKVRYDSLLTILREGF